MHGMNSGSRFVLHFRVCYRTPEELPIDISFRLSNNENAISNALNNDLMLRMPNPSSNALIPHFGDPDPLEEEAGISERGVKGCPCKRSEICVRLGSTR